MQSNAHPGSLAFRRDFRWLRCACPGGIQNRKLLRSYIRALGPGRLRELGHIDMVLALPPTPELAFNVRMHQGTAFSLSPEQAGEAEVVVFYYGALSLRFGSVLFQHGNGGRRTSCS